MKSFPHWFLVSSLVLIAPAAHAEPTRELYIEGREEVFEGDPVSTRLTAHAEIRVGLDSAIAVDGLDAAVTRLVRHPDGTLFIGTAGRGLLHLDARADAPVALTEEGIVTALAVHRDGVVFATADEGQVHRATGDGVEPFVRTEARYVWDLDVHDGRIWAVPGEPGTLVRLRKGDARVVFESDESHLRSVVGTDEGVLFGGGERGIVYRQRNETTRALYDSSLGEVTDLAWDAASGSVLAGCASSSEKADLPSFRWIGAVADENGDDDDGPFQGSELVRIDAKGRVEALWRSQREGLMDLSIGPEGVTFATGGPSGGRGRLYRVAPAGQDRLELLARLEDPLAPAFVRRPSGAIWVGTGGAGRIVRFGPAAARRGIYLSTEQDFQRVGRVGRLWFDADVPSGTSVRLAIRTGNTEEVDGTWSAWSEPVDEASGGPVEVPAGRYAQLRLEIRGSSGSDGPTVRSMHASVVRLNDPPRVHEVFVLQRAIALEALPVDTDNDKTLTLSSSTLDKLRPRNADDSNGRQRVRQNLREGHRTFAWHASDTNGDELVYRVEMKSLGASNWSEVARDLSLPFWSFDSRAVPDGRYVVRVSATDRPSNPPRDALTTRAESPPVLIDNTAPVLSDLEAREGANGALRVAARVTDASSPIVEAHVAVDGGPWLMMPAVDGLVDSRSEALRVTLVPGELGPMTASPAGPSDGSPSSSERPATRRVSVRVRDDAGNEQTASITVDVR